MLRRVLVPAAVAAGVSLGLPAPAVAQWLDWLPFLAPPSTTASIDPSPRTASKPPGWSGTPGASGHPEMTAAAIQTGAANFSRCVEGLWPHAARRGVSRPVFERHTAALTPDLRIMDLLDAQPEFTKAFWEYLDTLVTEARIQRGRAMLAEHRSVFDAVERHYQVDRHILAAIWGVESNFGTKLGDRPVVRSTATLACIGRRQPYFREEFLSALEILQRGDVRPERLKGSWAGAFGPTQFMPTAFKRHAVDFDRDGRRDIVETPADLFASTANMLRKGGWHPGRTWGYEVLVPKGFNYLLADKDRRLTVAQWQKLGVTRPGGKAFSRAGDRAYLLVPAGARGPAFLMLDNFKAIMSYNPAEAYALAIGHLADRLRGGDAFAQSWPRDQQALTRTERLELQQRLASRGFGTGEPDGRLGDRTRTAVREYQASAGLTPDGFASSELLGRLRTR